VRAVLDADLVLIGPGSWFTSVLPHLLVPELREALARTAARRVVVLNLVPQPGETAGFSPEQHLAVLSEHAPELRVDAVLADSHSVPVPHRLFQAAEELGGRAVLAPVGEADGAPRHSPAALAEALRLVLAGGTTDTATTDTATTDTVAGTGIGPRGREENTRWR
jgi:uncharacterized cofD-like protein